MGEKSPLRLTQITRSFKRRDLVHIEGDRVRQYAVFVFLVLIGLLLLFNSEPGSHRSKKGASEFSSFAPGSKEAERYMDKALQDAAKRTELESQRMDLDNKKWAPKIDESRIGLMQKRPYDSYQGFTKEVPEDKAADVYADVSHGDRYEYEGHPGPRIESLLARRKFVHEYDKASREEYVRQFLANALKEGYLIQLNDQLEVVRVQRVPTDLPLALPPGSGTPYQDQRPSPFDSGYSGSQ